MNNHDDSTPAPEREWVPVDSWQDDDPDLLAAAVEAAANYAHEEQT